MAKPLLPMFIGDAELPSALVVLKEGNLFGREYPGDIFVSTKSHQFSV